MPPLGPLAESSDRPASFANCDAPARCRLLADGYGLTAALLDG